MKVHVRIRFAVVNFNGYVGQAPIVFLEVPFEFVGSVFIVAAAALYQSAYHQLSLCRRQDQLRFKLLNELWIVGSNDESTVAPIGRTRFEAYLVIGITVLRRALIFFTGCEGDG